MDLATVIVIIGALFGMSAIVAAVYLRTYSTRSRNKVRGMVSGVMASSTSEASMEARKQTRIIDPEEIKRRSKEATRQKLQTTEVFSRDSLTAGSLKLSLENAKFFQAGIFTESDKRQFKKFEFASPVVCLFISLIFLVFINSSIMMLIGGSVLGLLIGVTIPKSQLERQIRARQDEILRQLPIVIEQISIGVSSSLDLSKR
jgi:Flp pilus assembly protein TadB